MTAPTDAPSRPGWKLKTKLFLAGIFVAPVLLFTLYTLLVLNWSYSDGNRSGVLQKFSRKGWICKTYEGELAQFVVAGVSPTIWLFSVRNPEVAHQLDSLVGRTVRLHYTEHHGIPTTCFATTNYFVDGVVLTQ